MPMTERTQHPRAWLFVGIFTFCYLVSSLDRYVVNLTIQPIATSLHLDDVQISMLVGLAFTLFYSTAGLLLGALVDRYDRRVIVVCGIVIWTMATAFTGLAWSYASLLLARILVGTGEAALSPSAYSIIAETFPPAKLSRPTSIYFLGGAIGPGISLVLGGLMLGVAEHLNQAQALGWLDNEPWRFVLLLAAAPGALAALAVFLFVTDPRRSRPTSERARPATSLVGELRTKPALYAALLIGVSAVSVQINGLAVWWPTHALRSFGWPLTQSGVWFGGTLAGGALIGIALGGSLGTAMSRRLGERGVSLAMALLSAGALIPMAGATLIPDPMMQFGAVALSLALAFAVNCLAPTAFQLAASPDVRGRIAALYVSVGTVVGAGVGPVLVAFIGQMRIGGAPAGLGVGLASVGFGSGLCMILAFAWASRNSTRRNE
ncbi:MFS transporter [Rhizorhabdus wittichii DC-6]|nr:MFS transporter [Rhizorhabdus wittichii DC-6]